MYHDRTGPCQEVWTLLKPPAAAAPRRSSSTSVSPLADQACAAEPLRYAGSTWAFAASTFMTRMAVESQSSLSPGIRWARHPSRNASVAGHCSSKFASGAGPPRQAAIWYPEQLPGDETGELRAVVRRERKRGQILPPLDDLRDGIRRPGPGTGRGLAGMGKDLVRVDGS